MAQRSPIFPTLAPSERYSLEYKKINSSYCRVLCVPQFPIYNNAVTWDFGISMQSKVKYCRLIQIMAHITIAYSALI